MNFIMMREDFHSFFKVFYHTEMLMKYSMSIIADSVFSIWHLRTPKDPSAEKIRIDSMNKQELANTMERSIQAEIADAIKMLAQYSSLVEHDQVNCRALPETATVRQRIKCFSRQYGLTLLSLWLIAVACVLRLKCVYERSMSQRERKLK